MRTSAYVLASLAIAGFAATTGAQNAGNPAAPRAQTPVRQPTTSPPAATPMPSPRTSPTPAQPTQPNSATPPAQPAQPMPANPDSTPQQTVRPPDSRKDPNNPVNNPTQRANPANNVQQRVAPASRGVGQQGRPDCSKLRGLEKSECERRDTSRDDLPAGVTTTQQEK